MKRVSQAHIFPSGQLCENIFPLDARKRLQATLELVAYHSSKIRNIFCGQSLVRVEKHEDTYVQRRRRNFIFTARKPSLNVGPAHVRLPSELSTGVTREVEIFKNLARPLAFMG